MNNIKKVINQITNLNGNTVNVFGRGVVVNNTVEYEDLTIDITEVLNSLEEFEITEYSIEEYNEVECIYNETICDLDSDEAISKYIDYLEEKYGLEYMEGNNTYNWNSPVSHNLHWEHYFSKSLDTHYYVCDVHLYGDIRGNYSDSFLLEFYNDYTFLETLSESDKYYTLKDSEGNEVYLNLSIFNEGLTSDYGEYEYNDLYLLDYDTIDEVQRDLLK